MTYYCFTKECLRDYILRYFGEYGSNYCGNCSNCKTQFDTVDMTAEARILAMCVKESHQRYGINVILDTVHGANNAKIGSMAWVSVRLTGYFLRRHRGNSGRSSTSFWQKDI